VQALIHDAETKARLLVTLDVDSAYPSVQPRLLREVLLDQGWPLNICEAAMAFCVGRRFSFRWAQSVFRSDTGLPQRSPWSPILFVLYSLPIIAPSQQGSSFMYMNDHAQPSWSKDPTQLAHHAAYRVHLLRQKANGLRLRIDPNKTEVWYIPPRGAGSKRHKASPERLALRSENLTASPKNSIKWLGVVLDTKLFPLSQGHRQSCNHCVYSRPNQKIVKHQN